MFAEMLTHSEEKIFLEAIDQYFEDESYENNNIKNKFIPQDNYLKTALDETESLIEKEKEADIEIMNIKFYEALNINEIKDISTDFESEDNSLITEKKYIKIRDCLILSKDSIENNKQKIFKEYSNQILLEEKIKELFKKDALKGKNNRNDILLIKNNCKIGISVGY